MRTEPVQLLVKFYPFSNIHILCIYPPPKSKLKTPRQNQNLKKKNLLYIFSSNSCPLLLRSVLTHPLTFNFLFSLFFMLYCTHMYICLHLYIETQNGLKFNFLPHILIVSAIFTVQRAE